MYTNLSIYYKLTFRVLRRWTDRFFRTETPDFVKFFTKSSNPPGKSPYKMYGIAPSCVDGNK